MKFSVMITTRNRCDDLGRTCARLLTLRPAPDEVLVCADGCTDGTVELVRREFSSFRLVENNPALGSVAAIENVSQEQLAMSVHASRQKVNAILRLFASRGWIELGYSRIRVLDVDAVERFARPD